MFAKIIVQERKTPEELFKIKQNIILMAFCFTFKILLANLTLESSYYLSTHSPSDMQYILYLRCFVMENVILDADFKFI